MAVEAWRLAGGTDDRDEGMRQPEPPPDVFNAGRIRGASTLDS
jgi:hypothetical protein